MTLNPNQKVEEVLTDDDTHNPYPAKTVASYSNQPTTYTTLQPGEIAP